MVNHFVIAGVPVSLQTKTAGHRKAWTERVREAARQAIAEEDRHEFVNVSVVIVQYCFDWSEGDLDNIAKPILDGLCGPAFPDDGWVTQLTLRRTDLKRTSDILDPPPILVDALVGALTACLVLPQCYISRTMERKPYPSDLNDAAWELIQPMVREAASHPGKQPVNRREIVNAILWIVRTGAQWRYMPHDLPHWRTVYEYFAKWSGDGTWEQIEAMLLPKAREASGRDPKPTLAIIDSQTAKTTESGGPRGYDGNKKMLGRKRNLVVDSVGLPIVNQHMPANVHDSQAAPDLIREAKAREPTLELMVGDKAYIGAPIQQAAKDAGIRFEITDHKERVSKFVPLQHRWKVERSFAWHGRYRRLSKDFERTMESSEGVMSVASIGILLRRATSTNLPENRSNTL